MHREPQGPGDETRELKSPDPGYRHPPPDRRHHAAIRIAERARRFTASQPDDVRGGEIALLHRHGRDHRVRPPVGCREVREIADHVRVRVAGDLHRVVHPHAMAGAHLHAHRVADVLAADAGHPDDVRRSDGLAGCEDDAGVGDVSYRRTAANLDAELFELRRRLALQPIRHRREQMAGRFEQDHAGLREVEIGVVARQDVALEFGHRTGELDSRRAAADDDDGHEPPLVGAVGDGRRVLETAQHRVSHRRRFVEILQPERMLLHRRFAEEVGGASGSDDEIVVRNIAAPGLDVLGGEIDALYVRHPKAHVRGIAQDRAHRLRDVVGLEAGGRDFVEERQERVEVVPVDDQHVDRGATERPGDAQAAEASADDHDSRPRRGDVPAGASAVRQVRAIHGVLRQSRLCLAL